MSYPDREPVEVIPEVLPPGSGGRGRSRAHAKGKQRRPSRLQLALIGLLLDLLDLATSGPLGFRFGFPLGFLAAFALLSLADLPLKRRLFYSGCAGVYCAIPGTERFPLGAIFGALLRVG